MFWIILIISVLLFIVFLGRRDHLSISGVYSQPGKWYNIKYWTFCWLITLRKRSRATGKDAGYGMKSRHSEKEMDCVQPLPLEHPLV